MFGRHFQVKLVKDSKTQPEAAESKWTSEEINRVAKDVLTKVAIATAATAGAIITLKAAADIAVNTADNHQKNKNN